MVRKTDSGLGKLLTDPIWWVYFFWLPDFLHKKHGLDLKNFGIPLAVIYIIADTGSVGGGYISSMLIKRGWSIDASRKTAMLICAVAVVPIVFASITSELWVAVILIDIAAAAHHGWSANIFTISSDMFPKTSRRLGRRDRRYACGARRYDNVAIGRMDLRQNRKLPSDLHDRRLCLSSCSACDPFACAETGAGRPWSKGLI